MAANDNKKGRGGARPGAGRPHNTEESHLYTFRASGEMAKHLDNQEHRTEYIKKCIARDMREQNVPQFGTIYPATMVKDLTLPFFDINIVAGFPIPLDNDERAESIELLQMLCPYPESCYLIRVEGNSMIEAGIHSGDIVIVDKSNRNPSPSEIAVCELNGEYTLKHFEMRDGEGWLVPANPDFPEIQVAEGDSFSIWGTVTFIIHRPK